MADPGQASQFQEHLFLSDVHLGAFSYAQNSRLEHELITLIDYCEQKNILIHILGDLFDYWMEYPQKKFMPSIGQKVLDRFEVYNKAIQPVTYILGNHDYWTYGHFKERGFRVIHDATTLVINELKILLFHGDEFSQPAFQLKAPAVNRLLKNRGFIKLYQKTFSPRTGLKIMKWFSARSAKNETFEPERLNNWASKYLQNNNEINVILCGHDHIARKETFDGGTYINTGAFFKNNTAALYKNYSIELVKWDAQHKQLTKYL